jgi:hypothetical protein
MSSFLKEQKLVPVYRSADVGRAEVIRAALEEQGIHCALENELQAGLSGLLECRLLVMEQDFEVARQFIESHE